MLKTRNKFIAITALLLIAFSPVLADDTPGREDLTIDLTDESEVFIEIDFSAGELNIKPGAPGLVAHVKGDYDDRDFEHDCYYKKNRDEGDLVLEVSTIDHHFNDIDGSDNYWMLELGTGVPIDLEMDIGAADCDLDLGGIMLTSLDIDVGAADCDMRFSEPNPTRLDEIIMDAGASSLEVHDLGNANFRYLQFDGGVGSYELDFSGDLNFDGEASISVGLGSIEVYIPGNVGVKLRMDDGLFSSIDFPERQFREIRDDVWESKNWDSAESHLELELDIGMGSAEITIGR